MLLKALALTTIIYTLCAASKSQYSMGRVFLNTGGSFGSGIEEARRKNRRNKIVRRQRSQ